MIGNGLRFLGILIFFWAAYIHGQTHISGDISKFVLDSANNPFIVEKDIDVPLKKKVVIGEGCVFLFKPFVGLNVMGSLAVNGARSHPVVFTTINDSTYNNQSSQAANPFDWNGINIDPNAQAVVLRDFKLMYSVYGLKSRKRDIIVKNGTFNANGQFHFTIFDKIIYVQDNISFSYPDDSTAIDITLGKHSSASLAVTSFPAAAEIYIDKKPGKRTSPDAKTPATIKDLKYFQVKLTLFKKGYADTMLHVNILPDKVNHIDISLNTIKPQSIKAQNRLLSDRFHARIGRYCFITSPVFIIGGAGALYYAEKNKKKADVAQAYLEQTIIQSGPTYDVMQRQYTDETRKRNLRFASGIALFGLSAIDLGAGILLYF